MRITLSIDSATATEAEHFVRAFQQTRHYGLPAQITTSPTVSMLGVGWTVVTPAMDEDRADNMMVRFTASLNEARTLATTIPGHGQ